ncbi:MAG: UbiA family prenyltransferase [Roseobacter sp.]|nr:UbiA family prenyltransferase [Roseobacter sp.]
MTSTDFPADILVVDLDGTLLRSDMLYESFWSALGQDWRSPLRAAMALSRGKPALKDYLAGVAQIDVSTLPYNEEVVAFVRARRAEGIRTALVTASDQALAEAIGAHLDLFDEVHGTKDGTNLKGPNKAAFLKETFNGKRLAYMGDSPADLPVWEAVDMAITVDVPDALRARVSGLEKPVQEITTTARSLKPYIKALRPHQWMKNVLVFLPMLTAQQLTGATFLASLMAFVAFSLIASSVYVLNDLLDLKVDRAHPRKRFRPFAAGAIPIAHGTGMAAGMLGAGVIVALLLGGAFFLTMLIYYLATLAYSLNLKRRAVVDICVLAGLYTMRIIAGSVATGIDLSVWLLAFSIFFFFSMAAIKRQAELVDMADRGQLEASGRGYTVKDLEIISMMALAAGYVSVLVMALYVNSPVVVELYSTPAMLWGICFILLYWISRVAILTNRGQMNDDPVLFAVRDRNSQICAAAIFALAVIGAVM